MFYFFSVALWLVYVSIYICDVNLAIVEVVLVDRLSALIVRMFASVHACVRAFACVHLSCHVLSLGSFRSSRAAHEAAPVVMVNIGTQVNTANLPMVPFPSNRSKNPLPTMQVR